ncbi:FecR family protein [Filimonas effusa]|nr:FecR domain-containing protein [Filimonas effusa]
MQQQPIDRQLLTTYLKGDCTPGQLQQVKQYFEAPQYKESLEAFLHEDWLRQAAIPVAVTPDVADQFQRFRVATGQQVETTVVTLRKWRGLRGVAAAACVAVVAVAGWLLYHSYGPTQEAVVATQWKTLTTKPGKVSEVMLPDSSMVYLGPASTLRYNEGYPAKNRQLYLQGEAYFIVQHREGPAFTVTTGRLTTVDIGTEFNISYHPQQAAIAVAVAKGKVEVLQQTASHTVTSRSPLTASQCLYYDTATAAIRFGNTAPDLIGAWRKGILHFRNTTLQEMALQLERYYNIQIRFSDDMLAKERITTVLRRRSLPDALQVLSMTAGVHCSRKGDTVWIKKSSALLESGTAK